MDSPPAPNSRVDRIAVVGLGNVGRLIADMLVERGFEVWEVDADESRVAGERASVMDVSDPAALEELFAGVDAVISCLPYYLNAVIATAAHSAGVHYLDLTEDVATSRTVKELARSSNTILMPRCGLAPGFICVVGGALAASLETVDRIELRVGALPRSPNNATRLCVQLVSCRDRQRVSERLRAAAWRRARDRAVARGPGDDRDRRRALRGVHHLRRPRDDVRNLRRTCRPPRLQDDPVSRSPAADAVHAAGAGP